jgi:hypothetical protein
LAIESQKKHANDVKSVKMWVEQNLNKIFYHQEIKVIVKGGLHGLTYHSQLVDKLFGKMNKCFTMDTERGFN